MSDIKNDFKQSSIDHSFNFNSEVSIIVDDYTYSIRKYQKVDRRGIGNLRILLEQNVKMCLLGYIILSM